MKGGKTLAGLAQQFDVYPNWITTSGGRLLEGAAGGSESPNEPTKPTELAINVKVLHAKIGELTLVTIFVRGAREGRTVAERKTMIDRSNALPVTRLPRELRGSRGSVYYLPRPISAADLAIMLRIDALHLDSRLRAAGCCATCSRPKSSRSAACTSRR